MTALYAALAIGGALVGADAWLRWQDRRACAWAQVTGEET